MNDILQAMETRRSIRQFKPDMPRKEDLQQIIEAGLYAANGRGRQGAIILAVTNKELRDRLSALNREIGGFPEGKAPSMVPRRSSSCWQTRAAPPASTTAASSWAT